MLLLFLAWKFKYQAAYRGYSTVSPIRALLCMQLPNMRRCNKFANHRRPATPLSTCAFGWRNWWETRPSLWEPLEHSLTGYSHQSLTIMHTACVLQECITRKLVTSTSMLKHVRAGDINFITNWWGRSSERLDHATADLINRGRSKDRNEEKKRTQIHSQKHVNNSERDDMKNVELFDTINQLNVVHLCPFSHTRLNYRSGLAFYKLRFRTIAS